MARGLVIAPRASYHRLVLEGVLARRPCRALLAYPDAMRSLLHESGNPSPIRWLEFDRNCECQRQYWSGGSIFRIYLEVWTNDIPNFAFSVPSSPIVLGVWKRWLMNVAVFASRSSTSLRRDFFFNDLPRRWHLFFKDLHLLIMGLALGLLTRYGFLIYSFAVARSVSQTSLIMTSIFISLLQDRQGVSYRLEWRTAPLFYCP